MWGTLKTVWGLIFEQRLVIKPIFLAMWDLNYDKWPWTMNLLKIQIGFKWKTVSDKNVCFSGRYLMECMKSHSPNRWIFYFNILTSHIAVDVSIYETFISVCFHIHIQLHFKITILGFNILSWKKKYCENKQVFGICNVLVYLGKLPKVFI